MDSAVQDISAPYAENAVFQIGDKFHGYVVKRLLGRGGLGLVYLVHHEMLDAYFALKVLYPEIAEENPVYVKRFVREGRIASRIRHPNLVSVHDIGYDSDRGIYYMIMDYVTGGTLRQRLALGGTMDQNEAVSVIGQVADALAAAAPLGVVHRDVKPENIMITPEGMVKLVDLGVAKFSGGDSLHTMSNSAFGTPSYISPEQALDASTVDTRADIYSLGMVLFEMLAGASPYRDCSAADIIQRVISPDPVPDVRTVNPAVSPKLAALVQAMCAKDVEKRIASPAALVAQLDKLGYVGKAGAEQATVQPQPIEASSADWLSFTEKDVPPTNPTLSFDTKDIEVKRFVQKLKQRKRNRFIIIYICASLIVAALLALILKMLVQ